MNVLTTNFLHTQVMTVWTVVAAHAHTAPAGQ